MSKHTKPFDYLILPDRTVRTIPPSQDATLANFLFDNRKRRVVWDEMYRAIFKSKEVDRCLHTLRHKWHIPVSCELARKKNDRGQYGLFRIADCVERIEAA